MTDLLSRSQVEQLTAIISGAASKRSATKEAAIVRLRKVANGRNVESIILDEALSKDFDGAQAYLLSILEPSVAIETAPKVPKAPKAKATKSTPNVDKGPTKRQVMLDMVCADTGASEAEICTAIGWKACLTTLRRAAEAEKVTLRVEKTKGERARYFGTR